MIFSPSTSERREKNWSLPRRNHLRGPICLAAVLIAAKLVSAQTQSANTNSTSNTPPGSGTVIVYVVGEDGSPVNREFDVTITRAGILYTDHYQTTNSQGMTQFGQLQFAAYQVTASAPGYEEGGAEVEVNGTRNPATVTVTVTPTDDNSPTPPDAKGLMLAPKAKQEAAAGISAMHAGHYDDAQEHLEAAYKMAPGNPDVNEMLGELFITTKDFDKAQTYIERAISIEPDNATAQTDMGYLHVQRKEYAAAQSNLERAVALTPRNWFTHWLLGLSYLNLNQPAKAEQQATAAIKVGKGQAGDAQYLLGESLALQGRNAEAIRALQQLLKDQPSSSHASSAKALIEKLKTADTKPIAQLGLGSAGPSDGSPGKAGSN